MAAIRAIVSWVSVCVLLLAGLAVAPAGPRGQANHDNRAHSPAAATSDPNPQAQQAARQEVSPVIQITRIALVLLGIALMGVSGFLWLLRRAVQKRTVEVEMLLKMQSQFLANMSHEIRTPLNGIVGMIDLALGTNLNTEQRQYLDMSRNSAESLLVVINDILDFSKIEAGKMHMENVPFEARKVIESALMPLLFRARIKGISLVSDMDAAVPIAIIGDPVRLGQVITNLVGNAIKFTEQGSVVLRGRTVKGNDEAVELEFSVADTGVGIPEERRHCLFQPFSQVDGSIARRYSGTGLGLVISSRLVALMGGRIWVESEIGKGSKFNFTAKFPVARGRAAQLDLQPAGALKTPKDEPLHVLLAEDNIINQKVVIGMLQKARNWRVTAVGNGREAVEALAQRTYDVVLMDVHMPEVDGYAATAQIREEQKLGIPIIALTANAMNGDRERCIAAGMDDYVSKPFKREELVNKIEILVMKARANGGNIRAIAS